MLNPNARIVSYAASPRVTPIPGILAPILSNLNAIKPGDHIKVLVATRTMGTECFWCIVASVKGDSFHATVDQQLLMTAYHGLADKSPLTVPRDCVLAILSN